MIPIIGVLINGFYQFYSTHIPLDFVIFNIIGIFIYPGLESINITPWLFNIAMENDAFIETFPSYKPPFVVGIFHGYDFFNCHIPLQGGAPKIAKLVYNSNNYGL